ncbi:DMT family transporter [Brevundimonas sp. 2R-24]|uniref:DMT family transporter n=1 Tax=Peiella sedimenti TaxID=3061083 RepID=A0ABT8SIY7_9CAUL|nr:DMT family transporter [Caulobacteraceae bacterium XZ-24]
MTTSAPHRLTALEAAALVAIVVIWGVNNAGAKLATEHLPPLFMGFLRFAIAGAVLAAFVRPPFPNGRRLLGVMIFGGPVHFGLIYLAFWMAEDVTPLSVSLQLWIPMTALFAFLLMGERLTKAAVGGMALAMLGVVWMTADPHALHDWDAILVGAAASAAWALATVNARRSIGVSPLKLQGMLALTAAPVLGLASILFEDDQLTAAVTAPPMVWASVIWASLISTVIATGLLFWLVQRREAGRVTPYMLATPVVSALMGWGFMGDQLTWQIVLGAALTLAGVGVVALVERRLRMGAARAA